ncbi:MAG: DUF3891 family protein [Vicinamibacterales bacterium]
MIVRPAESGCVLITQPDHAQLARRIMEHCVLLVENPRRDAILRAIGDHDNGWREYDAEPTVDMRTGDVVDFIHAPVTVRQDVWPKAVAGLADEPWAAALVANHAMFAYDRFRGDPAWDAFFAGLETSRSALVQASGLGLELLLADYAFLRLGDLISLAFCTGTVAPQQFRNWTVQLSGPRVVVTPGIFGGAPVTFEVMARAVRPPFDSDAELREALGRSVTAILQGEAA